MHAMTSMCPVTGDGFVTDESIISANGLSDPNGFFETLLTKSYLNQVGRASSGSCNVHLHAVLLVNEYSLAMSATMAYSTPRLQCACLFVLDSPSSVACKGCAQPAHIRSVRCEPRRQLRFRLHRAIPVDAADQFCRQADHGGVHIFQLHLRLHATHLPCGCWCGPPSHCLPSHTSGGLLVNQLWCAGEFGATFTHSTDFDWIHDLAEWMNNIGSANDGLHASIGSFFYWWASIPLLRALCTL